MEKLPVREIHLWGVKQNNLKNIEVKIPLGSFTVVCGPSGSGKSSLAFETLFAEGQRRFIESMSNYARQFLNKAPKPDIEGVHNIPPSISIEQKNTVKSSRSTVGTATELVDYLRLLFEKVGVPHCPTHHIPAEKQTVTEATLRILDKYTGQRGTILVEIPEDGRIADGKKLHSLLLQDGYLRIWIPTKQTKATSKKVKTLKKLAEKPHEKNTEGEIIEISEPAAIKKGLPSGTFYLVIDRMAFSKEDRGRLADSLQQAYEASIKYNVNTATRKCSLLLATGEILPISEEPACPECGWNPPHISSRLFSFNSPLGACPTCKGFGNILDLDENKVIPNPNLSIQQGALNPFTMPSAESDKKALFAFCKKQKISLSTPWMDLPQAQKDLVWNGNKDFYGVKGLFEYLDQIKYKMHVRVFISRYRSGSLCPTCRGSRLRPEVEHILIDGKNIHDLSTVTIESLCEWFANLKLSAQREEMVPEVLKQLRSRLSFLMRVGVNYLTLNRETRTLSGGEYQRLILANQLGMGLSQALYVLDEPTVGLLEESYPVEAADGGWDLIASPVDGGANGPNGGINYFKFSDVSSSTSTSSRPTYTDSNHGEYYHSSATLPGSTATQKKVRTLLYSNRIYRDYEMKIGADGKVLSASKSEKKQICDNIFGDPNRTMAKRAEFDKAMLEVEKLSEEFYNVRNEARRADISQKMKVLIKEAEAKFYGKEFVVMQKEVADLNTKLETLGEELRKSPEAEAFRNESEKIREEIRKISSNAKNDATVIQANQNYVETETLYRRAPNDTNYQAFNNARNAYTKALDEYKSANGTKELEKKLELASEAFRKSPKNVVIASVSEESYQKYLKLEEFKSGKQLHNPVLSKDGQYVAGLVKDKIEVFKIDTSGNCERVAQTPYGGSKVSFSYPENGKPPKITFTAESGASNNFKRAAYIYDLETKQSQIISKDTDNAYYPGFTKDGRVMFKSGKNMVIVDPNQMSGDAAKCISKSSDNAGSSTDSSKQGKQ